MKPSEVKRHLKRLGFAGARYPVIPLLHSCGRCMYWVLRIDNKAPRSLGAVCQQCNGIRALDIPLERLRDLTLGNIRQAQQIADMDEEGERRDREIVNNLIAFNQRMGV